MDPPGAQSDTNQDHDEQNAPLNTRDSGSEEDWTRCFLLCPLILLEPLPPDATTTNNPVDRQVDGNLLDTVPEKQTVEPPKGLQAGREFASPGNSCGAWGETDRKCDKNLGIGVGTMAQNQTAIEGGEEGGTRKNERMKQNKEDETKLKVTTNKVYIRCSQRPNMSKETVNKRGVQENKEAEEMNHSSKPKPSPDRRAAVDSQEQRMNEKTERPSLIWSPTRRHRREGGSSEESETRVNETGLMSSSPMKRRRWSSGLEVNTERDEQKLAWNKKEETRHEVDASGCKPSPPLTISNRKVMDDKILNLSAGQETSGGGKNSAMEIGASREGNHAPHFPCKRPTRSSRKLPSKYKDFILYRRNGHKQRLDKGKGKLLRKL